LESLRLEQEGIRREVLDRFEPTRGELEELRAGWELRSPSPPANAPAAVEIRVPPMAPRPTMAPPIVGTAPVSPRIECDLLARDLVLDRLDGDGDRAAIKATASPATPPPARDVAGRAAFGPDDVESWRLGELFQYCMRSGNFADAIATARQLVASSRDRVGGSSLEHALWLRNLAWSLSMAGGRGEARELLHRALDICRRESVSQWVPLATCLLEIAEFYVEADDRPSARAFCEEAMAVVEARSSPDSPLLERARKCLGRTGAADRSTLAMGPVSIST
jgi:hypothetical protein